MPETDGQMDPGESLRRAFISALEGLGCAVYAGGAVPADAEPPYAVLQVPQATPEETRTTLTWVTTASLRIHTRFASGDGATPGPMYALRQEARTLLAPVSRDLPGGYRLLRLRPPQQEEMTRTDDGRTHIDGVLLYELRIQER